MIFSLVYFIILLATVFILLYKYLTSNYDYWKKRNVPFVKPVFPFGSIYPVIAMNTTIGEWLWNLSNKVKEDICGIYIFNRPVLVVNSSKLLKAILQKDFAYFEDRSVVTNTHDEVTDNLLLFKKNHDQAWKQARSKITPFFTSGKLRNMFLSMLYESEEMTNYISKFANVPSVEAKEIAAKFSTNVITRIAFSIDGRSFRDENAEMRNLTREMFGFRMDTALRQYGSWFAPSLIKLFRVYFFHSKIIKATKRIFREVMNTKKGNDAFKGQDFIDLLMETNKKHNGKFFSEDAMVGHSLQFFAAGFETISSTMSFAFFELAIHPEMQDRLRSEILNSIEIENGLTYSGIQEMKYLDMIVCETLRKYPVLPFLDREAKADYKVEGTDLVIEKGTAVYFPMFPIQYNPKYYPNPEKFDPERFADKSKINNDGVFYIPFGEGPRICIGERYGLLAVKIGLAETLSKFRLARSPDTPDFIEFEPKSIILQSKVGVPLTFVPQ